MTVENQPPSVAFRSHDHARCSHGLIAQAEAVAASRGIRLTPVRRKVLEVLLEQHRAMGAYEVLERLAASGFGNQPPVAYRALEFLVGNGLAHRVARLNAFMACTHPGEAHTPAVLICRGCRTVAEAPGEDVHRAVAAAAAGAGFAAETTAVEVTGLCPSCREARE